MRPILIAFIALATAAQASAPQVLRFTAADFASPEAVARTYRRVQVSSELACNGFQGQELARQRVYRQCVTETVDHAVARIHNAPLSAYHAIQRGETLRTAAGSSMSAAITRQK